MEKDLKQENIKSKKLKSIIELSNLKKALIDEIKSIENYNSLRNELELIKYACCRLENLTLFKKEKIDKKEFIVKIFSEIFNNFNQNEIDTLKTIIQYLYNNDEISKEKLFTLLKTSKKIFFSCLEKLF